MQDVIYVQKYITQRCNLYGKPVLLTTQLLESMVNSTKPTRAEVVDITNAVTQGIDGLVLLPETSVGKYFEESVKMLSQICREAESQFLVEKANQRYLEH